MTFNFQEKYKDMLPAGFFEEMNKSKTAKKMAQLFMDHGFYLKVSSNLKGGYAHIEGNNRVVTLGLGEGFPIAVSNFCHEVVHCLQPYEKVNIEQLKQMVLCPIASSEFQNYRTALALWREIAAYNMSNRIFRELGKPEYTHIQRMYVGRSGGHSQLSHYRHMYSRENITSYIKIAKTDAILLPA